MAGLDLRHGDCLDLLRDIPDASVDCILTDPPYASGGIALIGMEISRPYYEISRRRLEPLAQHYIMEADHA